MPRARNVGTVALGTVLLGLGCTQRNEADRDAGLAFPEAEKADPDAAPHQAGYPEPEFGPLGRRAIRQQGGNRARPVGPLHNPVATRPEHSEARQQPKRELLATASEGAMASAGKPVAPLAQPALIAPPKMPTAANIAADDNAPPTASTFAAAFPEAGDIVPAETSDPAIATEQVTSPAPPVELAAAEPAPTEWPEVDFTPDPPVELPPQPAAISPEQDPAATLQDKAPPAEADGTGPIRFAEATIPPAPAAPVPARIETAPQLARVDTGTSIGTPAPNDPDAAPPQPQPAGMTAGTPAAVPTAPSPETSTEAATPALSAKADLPVRQRTIAARETTGTGTSSSQPAQQPDVDNVKVPELASVVPPRRAPIPMTTAAPPQPAAALPTPANDGDGDATGAHSTSTVSAPPAAALVPSPRTQSTLGLERAATGKPPDGAAFVDNRQSAFTASAEPPVLSYQDELILEVKVADFDASDTVIAYGTRQGVYLPLGTLARILDLAITVSDDGHFASGWVLREDRALSINLRAGVLTQQGKESPIAADAAVAFEGELYVLDRRFEQLMPLTIETDLRSQAIVIKTLEPFPFEERMRREASRKKLASRGQVAQKERWPREDTPYRIASLPVADVELRAVTDNTLGSRLEGDLQLAGDLGFLTAQAYVSGDTQRGLTSSLIELGRVDPDAELLGPLSATEFAVGDISTISMPIGLRGVSGRGAMVTNTPPESVSVFEKIDLRGILLDGYEVELYRNDILIGSTREAVNGQYEFLQVPVDFGLNVFRLVFFGPQGQRSEEVRRISVGDGRLPEGKLVYRFGAVQKGKNVLGVRPDNFIPPNDYGVWRATGELAYGLTPDITAIASGSWFETVDNGIVDDSWIASAGVRTGLGRFALKADLAAQDGGGFAAGAGIAGRFGNSAVTLSHVEYSSGFIDETRSLTAEPLTRSTELDLNTSLNVGDPVTGLSIPLTARIRHFETAAGRAQTNAALRASTRTSGFLISNTLEYSRTSAPQVETLSQLFGNFDLATAGRSKTRGRLSLGYRVLPEPDLISASLEADHAIDQDTAIRGSLSYNFESKSAQVGLSAVRDFDRFTLALDGNYGFRDDNYSLGLRLGFSFGRDPLKGNFFIARPGLASAGGVSARAFRDMDGDGRFGPGDSVLPEVDFIAYNQTATSGEDGIARLTRLGEGRGVTLQVDPTTLPDIDLAPVRKGIEIVPRPGRIHATDFPIVALSEVDGTVTFHQDGRERGVSGVRLQLRNASGKIVDYARTEIEGYYFFERVLPGSYTIELDPDQSTSLKLCADREYTLDVGYESDLLSRDIDIAVCQ